MSFVLSSYAIKTLCKFSKPINALKIRNSTNKYYHKLALSSTHGILFCMWILQLISRVRKKPKSLIQISLSEGDIQSSCFKKGLLFCFLMLSIWFQMAEGAFNNEILQQYWNFIYSLGITTKKYKNLTHREIIAK